MIHAKHGLHILVTTSSLLLCFLVFVLAFSHLVQFNLCWRWWHVKTRCRWLRSRWPARELRRLPSGQPLATVDLVTHTHTYQAPSVSAQQPTELVQHAESTTPASSSGRGGTAASGGLGMQRTYVTAGAALCWQVKQIKHWGWINVV